jgi:parallel beta-helix repeat protein
VSNTITFIAAPGTAPIVSGVAAGAVQSIRLGTAATAGTGPSWITLSGLTATGASTGAGIGVHGASNITIQNCKVYQCGAGISLVTTANSVVEDCEVYSVAATPGTPGSATYAGGISAYLNSDNVTIRRNRVHDVTSNGIFVGTSGDTTACDNPVVVNNMIWNCPGGANYGGGILVPSLPGRRSRAQFGEHVRRTLSRHVHSSHDVDDDSDPDRGYREQHRRASRHRCVHQDREYDHDRADLVRLQPLCAERDRIRRSRRHHQLCDARRMAGTREHRRQGNVDVGRHSGLGIHDRISTSRALLRASPTASPSRRSWTTSIFSRARDHRAAGPTKTTSIGIFAGFQTSTTSGPAALTVNFIDTTFSSNGTPASWAWDFENDGIVDSNLQFPTFTYLSPGTYSVSLTVTDPILGSNTLLRSNYITVSQYVFSATTSGFGDGVHSNHIHPHIHDNSCTTTAPPPQFYRPF